jgi:hypothetical protein
VRGGEPFALDRLAPLGPFFTLRTNCLSDGLGWRRVTDCLTGGAHGDQFIGDLGAGVADRLSGSGPPIPARDRWIAASVLQLGWAAHLTSVYAGTLAVGAPVPDMAADSLFVRSPGNGRIELGVERPVALDAEGAWTALYEGHLVPLGLAFRRQVRIGWRLLDGNIGSALAGALGTIHRHGLAPLDNLVNRPWNSPSAIARIGAWHASDGLNYQRTTCCGYEKLPQHVTEATHRRRAIPSPWPT